MKILTSRKLFLISAACAALSFSCESTSKVTANTDSAAPAEKVEETKKENTKPAEKKKQEEPAKQKTEPEQKKSEEPKKENTKPATESKTSKDDITLLEKTEPAKKEQTPAELYQEKTDGLKLSVASSPKETQKSKAFASPFTVSVKDSSGKAVSNLDLTVLYPSSRKNGEIEFSESKITSDANGNASFTAPVPAYAFDSVVKFFPAGDMKNKDIAEKAKSVTAEASYKVKTNLRNSGGIIAVLDYTKKGEVILSRTDSSSSLLMALMKLGFTGIGNSNSTINNAVIKGNQNNIYKATKDLVGSKSAFVVYGTVKYNEDATSLIGEITALSLKDGSVMYKSGKTVPLTGSDITKARNALAEYFAASLNYGL